MLHSTFHILSAANDICINKDQEQLSSILNIFDILDYKITEVHNWSEK